jgi:hypothetical protein
MKTITTVLMGFGLIVLGLSALAQGNVWNGGQQEVTRLRNDPTYSTRNYKQPNKAAAARRWEGDKGVDVRPPYAPANRTTSYKNQSANQIPAGGITVEHTPDESFANRNYKAQLGQPASGSTANTARKRAKDTVRDTVTGE